MLCFTLVYSILSVPLVAFGLPFVLLEEIERMIVV